MSTASLESHESTESLQNQKLSPVIRQRLIDFRNRLQQRKLWQLLTICIAMLLTGFLIQFTFDRFMETTKLVRSAIFITAIASIGIACWRIGSRWFWNTRRLTQVARLLRGTFPRLSDQVLSVVELAHAEGEQRRSPELVAAAMAQVEKRLGATNLMEALPHGVSKPLLFVAVSQLALVTCAFVFAPGAAKNALARLLNPWNTIERFTFARVIPLPDKSIRASGEPFSIHVTLDAESDWKPAIANCRVEGRTYQAKLDNETNRYQFELPGLLEDSQAQISIGDCIASTMIVPLNRPELSELNAQVELPSYLNYPQPIRTDARSGTLYLLPDSILRLNGRANRELSEVKLAKSSESETSSTPARLAIDSDRFQSDSWRVNTADEIQLDWRDENGLESLTSHKLKLRITQDKIPQIQCQGLSQVAVWLASDTLKFDVKAEDDYGIAKLGLQWRALESAENQASTEESRGERIIASGGPELKRLSAQATFNCIAEKVKPQALELRVFAEDYRGIDGRVYSVPYVIRFMSAAEHADWIAAQLRRWKGKLDSSHDNELQLLDENRVLRQEMLSGKVASSTAKQKLEQQATNERGNADKLQKTIEEGRSLLEQALRNEELRSQQIESWASALDRLNQIAQAAMPSVADKLDQASQAAGQSSNGKASSPSLSKPEKSMDKPDPNGDRSNSENNKRSNSGGGSSIPEALLGPGQKNNNQKPQEPSKSDNQDSSPESKQLLEQSIEEQMRLIEEFRRSKEAFAELLSELENSSFVKRFKAAAEVQRQLASLMNSLIGSAFGRPANAVSESDQTSIVQLNSPLEQAAENFERIQRDLDAYQRDNPAASREEVLKEMKSLDAITKLKEMPLRLERNLRGDTLNRLDFWADTLDRWAEELAGPGKAGGGSDDEEKPRDRLPSAILLEILRIIYDQIDLRDETRTLAQITPQDEAAKQDFEERSAAQAVQQMSIQQRTLNTVSDIRAIPSGADKFKEELQKLNKAVQHMDDASAMLVEGKVTDEIVSAQTAAIEALIESRRSGSGGGGGGSSGGGSMAGGSTNRQPLDLVGPASDKAAMNRPRQTGEGTGKTGRVLPEEYREGLDSFLNKLNQNRGQ